MNLSTSLRTVPGIGYAFAKKLELLGLLTVADLINHYPFRYEDFSQIAPINEAKIGEKITLQGEIWSIKNIYTRSRKVLTQALFNDGTAPIELTWFNQSYLTKSIQPGDRLQISGKVSKYKSKISIVAPVWEKISMDSGQLTMDKNLHTGRLVPVYSETFGLTSKWLRAKIASILPQVIDEEVDFLPDEVRLNMLPLRESLQKIHFPENLNEAKEARDRLGFDELFLIQLATQKARLEWRKREVVKPFSIDPKDLEKFLKLLPFSLTNAQRRVVDEICDDLKKTAAMNRLVQGEVGSGKTVVAAAITYVAFVNGLRTLFMAPTEVLAFQHFANLEKILTPLGMKVGIYTGSKKQAAESDVIVGTHALISGKLAVENVGMIVVDEQQRFGVEQRTVLRSKATVPHFLTMTATPIPRTVALTMYGDLDISIIDEVPAGRQQVRTHVVRAAKRADAYKFIHGKVKEGDQAYIVTPLIEESEILQAKAAKVEFENLQKDIFPDLKLGLLHGRMKSKEKEAVLQSFKEGVIDILVSTSVVEVGVDVPNATIMLIEGAERFGLSQLHQLRGRVGRGEKQSFCFLFSSTPEAQVVSRLKNLEKTFNGLKLAELDLQIRGSGEIFGVRQSGRFNLKIASFSDLELIERARGSARLLLQNDPTLDKYPSLQGKLADLASFVSPD